MVGGPSHFRPTCHIQVTVSGPKVGLVYKGNILQSLNILIIDLPLEKSSPWEKGFLLGPRNNQQIGA